MATITNIPELKRIALGRGFPWTMNLGFTLADGIEPQPLDDASIAFTVVANVGDAAPRLHFTTENGRVTIVDAANGQAAVLWVPDDTAGTLDDGSPRFLDGVEYPYLLTIAVGGDDPRPEARGVLVVDTLL